MTPLKKRGWISRSILRRYLTDEDIAATSRRIVDRTTSFLNRDELIDILVFDLEGFQLGTMSGHERVIAIKLLEEVKHYLDPTYPRGRDRH